MQTLEQTLDIISQSIREMEAEAVTTRRMLERVPTDKLDWQPHPKSMSLRALAAPVAELSGWPQMVLDTEELDFAAVPYEAPAFQTAEDLITVHDAGLAASVAAYERTPEEHLHGYWTLRNGDTILSKETRHAFLRSCLSQTIHHRAQLGVYLRLLDIPIPGSYGPSADEMN